jgi:hypothetical protein
MESDRDIEIRIEDSVAPANLTPEPSYSEVYLDELMHRAKPAWESVPDSDAWLEELRGGGGHSQDVV